MDSDLLPVGAEAPRCSDFSRRHGARPAGTGLSLDRVILVAVPEPWPKPALSHPLLKPSSPAVAQSAVTSRLFAAVPWGDGLAVELFERTGLGFARRAWRLDDPAHVATVVSDIAGASLGDIDELVPVTTPTFLICTQGSHDDCCGVDGERLAAAVEADRPDSDLRRVSHTGGHRYAPTFLSLPSGRMWAYGDLGLVGRIADARVTSDDVLNNCRGWLGASGGPAQVAELVARAAAGRPFAAEPQIDCDPHDHTRWTVAADTNTTVVEVRPGVAVPAIACGAPGGLPAKPGKSFDHRILEQAWN